VRSVVVVGASLGGLAVAEALRAEGFAGALTLVGAEPHLPYDRPPLSKSVLAGEDHERDVALLDDARRDELGAQWRLGVAAERLDRAAGAVHLSDGSVVTGDAVVLATGSVPRRLAQGHELAGVHVLRTLEDAIALRSSLVAGARVVVVGGGWIGGEVASAARQRQCEVTVVEACPLPLEPALGPEVAAALAQRSRDAGVVLRCGAPVSALLGARAVSAVELADGTVLPADVVVVGVGAVPATGWLEGSGLQLADGVVCDAWCFAGQDEVLAVGDCARWWHRDQNRPVRIEHWTNALEMGAAAARSLLHGRAKVAPFAPVPYVWSDQYGVRLQFAGWRQPGDAVRLEEGSFDEGRFLVTYLRAGQAVAALGVGLPRPFARARRQLVPHPAGSAA
jgi:NADPH-dependent 2,4-dienoyl-CoA reductase/sulfur reductase-like enzyme